MSRNIEIKASAPDLQALESHVREIADSGPEVIDQDDTFFRCDTGRLKLRQLSNNHGELIFYQRADVTGPKSSFYLKTETGDPEGLRQALDLAYGKIGRVKKRRVLYLSGKTRIHLDTVNALGTYVELERVLDESESTDIGTKDIEQIIKRLKIEPKQLVKGAYLDLLASLNQ